MLRGEICQREFHARLQGSLPSIRFVTLKTCALFRTLRQQRFEQRPFLIEDEIELNINVGALTRGKFFEECTLKHPELHGDI